ncbi:MAG: oxygen-independent coproporphyrinogen III oxidase [Lachnospiraceae bacterium]|nr:oxygen-independent coproporphyrinogen III oxidase [Lachnospiraceae bacterium]
MEKKPLSVYIHIPFCVRKCLYCDFLSAPAGEEEQHRYIRALLREIKEESGSYVNYEVHTVFIGGGTPSVLPGEDIGEIMDTLRENYELSSDCEISMEVNPGTVTEEKAILWKKAGINRISIGLQSAMDEELQALGRIHNSSDFFETYNLLVKTGFNNINIDLMSAIPCQTLESYEKSLRLVTDLRPQPVHISAYSLIVEEGTPFYEAELELPDEDAEREMYKITDDFLSVLGYSRYEISNYAKPGYECRHNQVYWQRGDYVGFGLGSASLVTNVRFHNCRDMESYVNFYSERFIEREAEPAYKQGSAYSVKEDVQKLTVEEQMEEFMFLGLRMMKGVSCPQFQQCFGKTIDQVYPGITDKFVSMGLLHRGECDGEERIALTKEGIDVSNQIMAEFLLS